MRTNLLGSLLATQAAMRHMAGQPGGGHIFNFEGAGSDGAPTPQVCTAGLERRMLQPVQAGCDVVTHPLLQRLPPAHHAQRELLD